MFEDIEFTENDVQTEESENDKTPRLIYVNKIGTTPDGQNIYHFMYSDDIDNVWMEQWSEKPACNCHYLCPDAEMVTYTKEVKTEVDLITCTSACCNSYGDICDNVLSIAYENIDGAETYPEPFRIVLHYGDTMDDVDAVLAKRDIVSKFVQK